MTKASAPARSLVRLALLVGLIGTASRVDLALTLAGVATATGSATFAGYMLATNDRAPLINGLEYLALFAQPRGATRARPETPAPPVATAGLDFAATGSIAPGSRGAAASGNFEVVAAESGLIWLRKGAAIFAARPGERVLGLGRIAAIVRRDGRWIALGEDGTPLLSDAPARTSEGEAGHPFAKPMILDSPAR
jgi:hypothetical protein